MRGDRSVRGSQCGRDGDRGEETVQLQRRRSFSLRTAAVSAEAPETKLMRHVKEMNLLSAHQSSNPICPATQSVSHGPAAYEERSLAADQVIGITQRDEALRVFGRREDAVRVFDPDGIIARSVTNEQCLAQPGNPIIQAVSREVVEKFAPDTK
jgi:hypothetical protein